MLEKVVYISSDLRSGSTLLDLLLGNHTLITSLGELNHLQSYATKSRKFYKPVFDLKCMCGEDIDNCIIWKKVQDNVRIPFSSMRLRICFEYDKTIKNIVNRCVTKIIHTLRDYFPFLINNRIALSALGYNKLSLNRFLIYSAVSKATGTPIVVDSSKHPIKFKSLNYLNPDKIRIILLYRDPVDVVYSKVKRGENYIKAAKLWNNRSRLMDYYSKGVHDRYIIRVKYEELCSDPKSVMVRISNFLDIDYEESMILLNKNGKHILGGSPMKNNKSDTTIKQRKDGRHKFTNDQIKTIYNLTYRYAKELGYV